MNRGRRKILHVILRSPRRRHRYTFNIQFGKPPRLNTEIADSVEDNETQMYPSSKTRRENRIRRNNNIKCDDGEKK